jgi:hypothetical protein
MPQTIEAKCDTVFSPRVWVWILNSQIVLALFCPPVSLGAKTLFMSDLFLFAWVFAFIAFSINSSFWKGPTGTTTLKQLLIIAVALGMSWIHGMARPELQARMHASRITMFNPQPYEMGREALVALRFLSWIWATLLVTKVSSKIASGIPNLRAFHKSLGTTLTICMAIASSLIFLDVAFPECSHFLTSLYLRDPSLAPWWKHRAYGPFGSPIEAALTLSFGAILLWSNQMLPKALKLVSIAWAALAFAFTQTVTPLLGMLLIPMFHPRWSKKTILQIFSSLIVTVGVLTAVLYLKNPFWFVVKWGDLTFRLGPWKVYLQTVAERWDLILLGLGFYSYNVDNIYIFIISRLGWVTFVVLTFNILRFLKTEWPNWSVSQRAIPVYLMVSGFTLDSWIVRPVVFLWIAYAVPMLITDTKIISEKCAR